MARKFVCTRDYPVVETAAGKVRGFELDSVITFYGIKYADAERFQMPHPVEKWDGIKDATNYGPVSPTYGDPIPNGELLIPHRFWPENEHCQYLNIWTPSLDKAAKKPVLVWFHGGGFSDGSSIEQVAYEGDNLCKYGDAVVVTVNHRLNILGFLDMSSFGKKYENSVNAGLADIVASLEWVRDNIAAFGGDPDNVTIFGQSGGGGKVYALLQTPAANGLYHRAFMMSGGCGAHDGKVDHRPFILEMLKILGLQEDEFENLERIPYSLLMKVFNKASRKLDIPLTWHPVMWHPVANGWYLGTPFEAGFSDYAKKVPTMVSSVISEFNSFGGTGNVYPDSSEEEKTGYIDQYYNGHGKDMLALFETSYPGKDILISTQLDFAHRPSVIKYMDARAACDAEAPAYVYQLALTFDVNGGTSAWHCSDIPFVFHNTCRVGNANIEGVSDSIEEQIAGALIAFARTGDPNHPGMPEWKPYTTDEPVTMVFDRTTEPRNNLDRELLAKASEYGPKWPEFKGLEPPKSDDEDENGRAWLY